MVTEVAMPVLGLTMEEGTVLKWLKSVGEPVGKGEPLLEIMTDKVNAVVESPGSGVLRQVLVGEGAIVPVKTVLAYVAEADEALPGATPVAPAGEPPGKLKMSPAARRVAREHGLTSAQLAGIQGRGPGGRVVEEDVWRYLKETRPSGPEPPGADAVSDALVPLVGLRRTIAERMSRSVRTVADVTLGAEVHMTEASKLRDQLRREWEAKAGLRVSFTDLVVKAVARALEEHPYLNASLKDESIVLHREINIGVAVTLRDGLVVPVIRNANKKPLQEIARALAELTARARAGELSLAEVAGGTFTVSNLGMYGVGFFTPIINHPEAAILGVGKVAARVVLENGHPVDRPEMVLSLTFDHRVVDGAPAAEFLSRVKEILENPYLLLV